MPERFRQIEELYHAAREASAEERAVLPEKRPELRREANSDFSHPARRDESRRGRHECLRHTVCHRLSSRDVAQTLVSAASTLVWTRFGEGRV